MVAYGYIQSIALCSYTVMFLIFLSAKKDKLVNSFLMLLLGMLCWTGGSVLMRLEMWPSYIVWYHVSLLGILMIPYAYYGFMNALAGTDYGNLGKIYLIVMLTLFIINIPTGLILKWPELVEYQNVHKFVYHTDYKVAAFFIVAGLMIFIIFRDAVRICKKNRNLHKQFEPVAFGLGLLFVGNMLISLPLFKGFPIDILCGLINAFILMFALIRRRLFRLQMLASQSLTYVLGLLISLVLFVNLSPYIDTFLRQKLGLTGNYYLISYAISFLIAYLIITNLWKILVNNIFIKEEMQQAEKLKQFSLAISKTLRLKDIMAETIQIINETINPESVYICIQDNEGESFKGSYSNHPLNDLSFELKLDHPLVTVLEKIDEPLYYSELKNTTEFRSMWEQEKEQLEHLGLQACIGMKDDSVMTGIILLADKDPKHHVGYNDMQLLSSIGSISSIAIKNSRLYEKAYIEARTDEMTGLLNRKYFIEVLNNEFEENRDGSIVLAIFNVDDFKLYNQLYGVKEGDNCLKRIADIIRSTVGTNGMLRDTAEKNLPYSFQNTIFFLQKT